jgi:hypothetical protein
LKKEIFNMKKTTLTTIKAHFEALAIDNQTTEYAGIIDELTAEIDRITAKAAYVSPAEQAKKERSAELYNSILDLIAGADAPLPAKDIREQGGYPDSPQKITNVLNRLVADGKINRNYDKRLAYYTFAGDNAEYLDREVTV